MTPEKRRKELVEIADVNRPIWQGDPAKIAGWRSPDNATITTKRPGFWGMSWEAVERVIEGKSTMDTELAWLISNAWLGY